MITRDFFVLLVCLLFAAAILGLYWIGYRGYADEIFLIRGALGWLEAFPYVGTTHWELRHPYVLSTALSAGLFGKSELSFLLPNLVVAGAIVSFVFWFLEKKVGVSAAALTAMLIASTPVFVASATTLMPDLFETLFVLSSFGVYLAAIRSKEPTALLIAAGVLAGFAFVTRETSVVLLVFFFGAFLFSYGLHRLQYFWLAAGFLPVWLAEVVYIYLSTGDPFYRYIVDLVQYHPPVDFSLLAPHFDNPDEIQFARDKLAGLHDLASGGGDSHPPGPVDFGRFLNPLLYLFTNHEYGLLWLIGLPALFWGLIAKANSQSASWIRPLSILAVLWFVTISYVLGMRPIPRYYLVPLTATVLISAVFLLQITGKFRIMAILVLCGLLFVNVLATDLRTPRALHERTFLSEFADRRQPVHTRPDAVPLIKELAVLQGIEEPLLETTPPSVNDRFLYIERRYGRNTRVEEQYLPNSNWEVIYEFPQRERLLGKILKSLPIQGLLPEWLINQLRFPEPPAKLMRVK